MPGDGVMTDKTVNERMIRYDERNRMKGIVQTQVRIPKIYRQELLRIAEQMRRFVWDIERPQGEGEEIDV